MNTEFLGKQVDMKKFFFLLWGLSGWFLFMILSLYFLGWLFTSPQLGGYYLQYKTGDYKVKAYWKNGIDNVVYHTTDGKSAVEILEKLNSQFSPLKVYPTPKQDRKTI